MLFVDVSDTDDVICSNQFVEKDVAVVMQLFKYTMNVLHAAVAVQSERRLKLQTEACHVLIYICCSSIQFCTPVFQFSTPSVL